MKSKLLFYVLIVFLNFGIVVKINAQVKTIPLWSSEIPGEIKDETYQEIEIYKDNLLQSTSKVKVPTLTIYQPKKPNGTAVLIFPGGGYTHLAMLKEGQRVAEWFNSLGITAFVLKYRLPNDQIMSDKNVAPLQDAQEAIRVIRKNASQWNVDKNKIGILGFSAGGHLASTLSTHYNEKIYEYDDSISARPDFSLLIYPVISMKNEITHKGSQTTLLGNNPSDALIEKFSNELQITPETPPTFIIHATDDKVVMVENSLNYYLALKKNKVSAEMHIYEKGGHGFGLGVKDTSQFWTTDCVNWLKNHLYL